LSYKLFAPEREFMRGRGRKSEEEEVARKRETAEEVNEERWTLGS